MTGLFREALARSYVAAVAIAVLLLQSLSYGLQSLRVPLFNAIQFLAIAASIRGIPSSSMSLADRLQLIPATIQILIAATQFAAACLLSSWVYGVGPLDGLSLCRSEFARRDNA